VSYKKKYQAPDSKKFDSTLPNLSSTAINPELVPVAPSAPLDFGGYTLLDASGNQHLCSPIPMGMTGMRGSNEQVGMTGMRGPDRTYTLSPVESEEFLTSLLRVKNQNLFQENPVQLKASDLKDQGPHSLTLRIINLNALIRRIERMSNWEDQDNAMQNIKECILKAEHLLLQRDSPRKSNANFQTSEEY